VSHAARCGLATIAAARELAKSSGKRLDIQLQQEEPEAGRAFFAARSTIVTDATGLASRKGAAQVSPAVMLERFLVRDARVAAGAVRLYV